MDNKMNAPEKIIITPNECEDGSQWDMIGEEVIGVLEKPYFHFPAGFEVGASYTYIRLDLHETALADKDKRIKELETALNEAADIFDNYHDLHAAKNPPDTKKALANKAHADKYRKIARGE